MWTAEDPHCAVFSNAVTSLCLCGCCMTHYIPWQLVKDMLIPLEGSATSRYKYLLWLWTACETGSFKHVNCYLCLIMLQVFAHFNLQTDKTVCILCALKILWPFCVSRQACSFLWNVSLASAALYRETVNSIDKMAAWNQWKLIWNRQKIWWINWTVKCMLVQQNSVETRTSCEVVLKCLVFSLLRSCYEVKSKVIFVR
jgi:hypothetical protein